MSWTERVVRIALIRGIGTGGLLGRIPIGPVTYTEYEGRAADAGNLHAIGGIPTNALTRRFLIAAGPDTNCTGLAWRAGEGRALDHLLGCFGGYWYTMGPLTREWGSALNAAPFDQEAVWTWDQSARFLYLTNGVDKPLVFNGSSLLALIPEAPAAPPSLTLIAAGSVSAGVYRYVYTRYRSSDGLESSPSPEALVDIDLPDGVTTGVRVSGFVASPDALDSMDRWRIYRTTGGGATFRLLAEIDSSKTSYDDTTADDQLSIVPLSTLGALDSTFRARLVTAHRGTLYFANTIEGQAVFADRVRWTRAGSPWILDPLSFDDSASGPISALASVSDGPIVFSHESAHILRALGGGVHRLDNLNLPGCIGPHAHATTEGGIAWLSQDGAHFMGLSGYDRISSGAVEDMIRRIPAGYREGAWVQAPPKTRDIYFGLPIADRSATEILAYNLDTKDWWRINYRARNSNAAGVTVGRFAAVAVLPSLQSVFLTVDHAGFLWEHGRHEGSSPVWLDFRRLDLGLANRKRLKHVDVTLRASVQTTASVRVLVDGGRETFTASAEIGPSGIDLDDFMLDEDELGHVEDAVLRVSPHERCEHFDVEFDATPNNFRPGRIELVAIDCRVQTERQR